MKINFKLDERKLSTPSRNKIYYLGQVQTTVQDLLDASEITITDNFIPVIAIADLDSNISYYLLPDLNYDFANISLRNDIAIQESELISLGGGGTLPISQDIIDALLVANAPDASNPFVTLADLSTTADDLDDVATRGSSTNKIIKILRDDSPARNLWSLIKYNGFLALTNNTSDLDGPLLTTSYTIDGFKRDFHQANTSVILQTDVIVPNNAGELVLRMPFENGTIATKEWVKSRVATSDNYIDDAAAAVGGKAVGDLYHTAGVVKIRLA